MLTTVKRNFPGVWNDFFHYDVPAENEKFQGTEPKVNILETQDVFRVELAAPGLKKEDFKLNLEQDVLTVSSEKEWKSEEKEEMIKREFAYARFSKAFVLPDTVDQEKIKAGYQDGILRVDIPKLETAVQKGPKQINIE